MENLSNGKPKDSAEFYRVMADWIVHDQKNAEEIARRLKQQVGGSRIVWTPEANQMGMMAARTMMLLSLLDDATGIVQTVHQMTMGAMASYCKTTSGLQPLKITLKDLRYSQEAAIQALLGLGLPSEWLIRETGDDKPSPIIVTGS